MKFNDPSGKKAGPVSAPGTIVRNTVFCCSWCICSIGLVYIDRWLFLTTFPFPVTVAALQQTFGLFFFLFVAWLHKCFKPADDRMFTWGRACLIVMPMAASFTAVIALSCLCLMHAQVSTYHTARSLTLAFAMLLSYWMLGERFSLEAVLCCTLVCFGFVLGAADPATLSMLGVAFGAGSSLAQAVYIVRMKHVMANHAIDNNSLLVYNMLIAVVLLVPLLVILGEGAGAYQALRNGDLLLYILLLGSGFVAFWLKVATYMCVRNITPTGFNVLGYVKASIQSLCAIYIFNEITSIRSVSGIVTTIVGGLAYTHFAITEVEVPRDALTDEYDPLITKRSAVGEQRV